MLRSLAAALLFTAAPAAAADDLAEAREILAEQPVFDGHNDLPYGIRENDGRIGDFPYARLDDRYAGKLVTDAAGMKAGGVGAQFWSVYVPASLPQPEAAVQTLEQIDMAKRLIAANPDSLALAATAEDVRRIMASGKVAGMFGVEGGYSIANSLGVLRQFYDLGVRYMTLTHSQSLDWADSATDAPKAGGLSEFGREVVHEMNRLGMLVDLSHTAPATMRQAIAESAAPVIFSHSSTRGVANHARNVPDDVLAMLPQNGGVVMITFVESFLSEDRRQWGGEQAAYEARMRALEPGLSEDEIAKRMTDWEAKNPAPKASVEDAADHVDYARKIAGIDHIGIGSDFDGVTSYPSGLTGPADYPNLFAELLRRGYSAEDLKKISSGNVLRVLEQAEQVAARLQGERGPSEMRFSAEAAAR